MSGLCKALVDGGGGGGSRVPPRPGGGREAGVAMVDTRRPVRDGWWCLVTEKKVQRVGPLDGAVELRMPSPINTKGVPHGGHLRHERALPAGGKGG